MRLTSVLTTLMFMTAGLLACGGENGIVTGAAPRLEVSDGTNPILDGGKVSASNQRATRILVANTGSGPLLIKSLNLVSDPADAFTLTSVPMPTELEPISVLPGDIEHEFTIQMSSTAGPDASATITIVTNKTIEGFDTFTFEIAPERAVPRLLVQPTVVDFETVSDGASSTKSVALLNTGAADLVVSSFFLSGHPGFSIQLGGDTYEVTAETASEGVTLTEPLIIPNGSSEHVSITYTSAGPEGAEGALTLIHNDPAAPAGTTIEMYANVAGPCIKVNPSRVDFGGKLVAQQTTINVEIQSCGDRALEISAVDFVDDAGVFSLNTVALGVLPLALEPGTSVYLPVTYFPSEVAGVGADGSPTLDEGLFTISSNAFIAAYDVEVTGFGTDGTCPDAVITVSEGEEVIPQTMLHLSAANSTATDSTINGWEWSVVQPQGSASQFLPSPYVENPSFEANVVGEYIFRLKVFNTLGTESCEQASFTVYVTSPEAIHVELLWTTPGDIDETDEGVNAVGNSVGTDVDLHFTHPNAKGWDVDFDFVPDGWFDATFDTYWSNPNPNWAGASTNDDPRLDRDDTDGAGPENLNLSIPETGKTYKVGVHYWNDWGYGTSFSTVRVYIHGQLRYQSNAVQMINHDMWEACTIDWPSGYVNKIEEANGAPLIRHNYWSLLGI